MAKPGNKLWLLTQGCPGNAQEAGNSGADRRQTEGSGEVRMRRSLKSSLAPLTNNLVIISFWSQNLDQFSFWSQNLQNQNRLKFTCERGGRCTSQAAAPPFHEAQDQDTPTVLSNTRLCF